VVNGSSFTEPNCLIRAPKKRALGIDYFIHVFAQFIFLSKRSDLARSRFNLIDLNFKYSLL